MRRKKKKLEILKDPHIGAAVYFFLLFGFGSEIKSFSALICVCFSLVFSRILSALGVLILPKAKKDGMAKTESENSSKKTVAIILILEFVVFSGLMIFILTKAVQISEPRRPGLSKPLSVFLALKKFSADFS